MANFKVKRKKYYVKFPKESNKAEIVYTTYPKKSKRIGFVIGGYRTKKEAVDVAHYQGRQVK